MFKDKGALRDRPARLPRRDRADVAGLWPRPVPVLVVLPMILLPRPLFALLFTRMHALYRVRQGRPATAAPDGGPQSAPAWGYNETCRRMPSPPPDFCPCACRPTSAPPLLDGALRAVLAQITPDLTGAGGGHHPGQRLARRHARRGPKGAGGFPPCPPPLRPPSREHRAGRQLHGRPDAGTGGVPVSAVRRRHAAARRGRQAAGTHRRPP